jgi:oxaloacetate decarboxylase alpha subunit
MNNVDFVDTTLRDGHHSLWAQGMRTGMMLPVAKRLDQMGFRAIEVIGTGHFKKCIRELRENPWTRIDLMNERITHTPISFMMATSVTAFDITPFALLELYVHRLVAHGVDRIQVMDPSNDMSHRIPEAVGFIQAAGADAVIGLVFSESPVHTDDYYEARARAAAALSPAAIFIKDSAGLLTPERTRTLVPAVQRGAGNVHVEFHSHCTTGLAPICYVEAMKLGVQTMHTAIPPLANGSSQPSLPAVVHNARLLGFDTRINLVGIESITEHFTRIAHAENLAVGAPVEYDIAQYLHHVPGGVISHLRHQLTQIGQLHRLPEVLKEIAQVREDLGYPIMVTPFSQFICSQATLNVILGERYLQVPDQLIQFALSMWGKEAGVSMNAQVRDKILSKSRTGEITALKNEQPTLDQIRAKYGRDLSDEDLLLHYIAPSGEVQAMHDAGPPRMYGEGPEPLELLLAKLLEQRKFKRFSFSKGDVRVNVHG